MRSCLGNAELGVSDMKHAVVNAEAGVGGRAGIITLCEPGYVGSTLVIISSDCCQGLMLGLGEQAITVGVPLHSGSVS